MLALACGVSGCRTAAPASAPEGRRSARGDADGRGRLYTAEDLHGTQAVTLIDALQRLNAPLRFGGPNGVTSFRGRNSVVVEGTDVPLVIVDGMRSPRGTALLRELTVNSVASVRLLSASEALVAHGFGVSAGAIEITTRMR